MKTAIMKSPLNVNQELRRLRINFSIKLYFYEKILNERPLKILKD